MQAANVPLLPLWVAAVLEQVRGDFPIAVLNYKSYESGFI